MDEPVTDRDLARLERVRAWTAARGWHTVTYEVPPTRWALVINGIVVAPTCAEPGHVAVPADALDGRRYEVREVLATAAHGDSLADVIPSRREVCS